MQTIRAVIVDDEPLAQDGLRILLEKEPDIQVEAVCGSGKEAVAMVGDLAPDVLFLDIEMPRMNGFDVIREINPERMPQVIFVTAYDQYAVDAFNFHAMDYLLKPVSGARLRDSLRRLRNNLQQVDLKEHSERLDSLLDLFGQQPGVNAASSESPCNNDRIVVKSHGHVYFLTASDIAWIEASGDYVTIHTTDKSHLLRETMNNMEKRLQAHGFKRIHRSSIINLAFVRELKASQSNDYQVVLTDGTALNLGRRFKDALYASLAPID